MKSREGHGGGGEAMELELFLDCSGAEGTEVLNFLTAE